MPTVSVIIPTYQRANLVPLAIKSVLAQTYQDYEIIVVNDGSTDNTKEVLAKFVPQIIAIHQENRGLSAARNTGIKASQGKYIAFLDDDDRWLPEKLAKQIPILETKPKVGLVFSDTFAVDNQDKVLGKSSESNPQPKVKVSWTLFEQNFIPVVTVVLRRACLDEVGLFDESLTACEDYDLWLRIIEKWSVYYLDEALTYYRQGEGSMQRNEERMWLNWLRVKEKALTRNQILQRLPYEYLDRCYYNGYFSLAKFYLDRDRHNEAKKILNRYRKLRGYNISLELLKSSKKIAPPVTMNSHKQFVFVHIPKTAGSSIIEALFPELRNGWGHYQSHYLPQEYTAEIWNDWFTCCFIRNPWDRMVSLYHYWEWCNWASSKTAQPISFQQFCGSFPKYVSNIYHHYKQVDFIYRNDTKIDFIGRFENLESDFEFICNKFNFSASLPHLIPSQRNKDYADYYDDETRDFVAEYFAEDIQLGNYKF